MIPKRTLGSNGPSVGAIGYGAMVLEGYYGAVDDRDGIRSIHRALDEGVTMIDTADAYGGGHNESLVAAALLDRRNEAFIATKFGIVFEPGKEGHAFPTGWGFNLMVNGTSSYTASAIDASLRRLMVDEIDLVYLHYPDPTVPLEETIEAMATCVRDGKVKYLGLSNVSADQVRKAHSVHPISAVQFEYSLWRREAERDLLPVLTELGIALVPWAPLGSGFLTGTVMALPDNDFRRKNPKFTGGNFRSNVNRFAPLNKLAASLQITPAQLALAWILHKGDQIVPIPGTRKPARVGENAAAATVQLDESTLKKIDEIAPPGVAVGETLV